MTYEVAHRKGNHPEKGWYETMFWGPKTVLFDIGDEVPVLIDEEAGHPYQAGDADGEEAEAYFPDVEVVDWRVNKGKYFEE